MMDALDKLSLSAQATVFESEGVSYNQKPTSPAFRKSCGFTPNELRKKYGPEWEDREVEIDGKSIPVKNAVMPGGKRIPLLKAMVSTACERNCLYCPFRAGSNYRRVIFTPEELARTFFKVYQARTVEGIFLSTGILNSGSATQTKLIDTASILREKLGYRGYLHLKIMPGVELDQVQRAMELADRVSINLEAPNQKRLSHIAPRKYFHEELLPPLQWIEEIRRNQTPEHGWNQRWPSSATQFVVGAAGENDLEILSVVAKLYRDFKLSRAYFEAFSPIAGTPLEAHPAEDPLRQHRLYQASFLMRDYSFDLEDLPFTSGGQLPLDQDPKLAYAQTSYSHTPVEINNADRSVLLRVPGIGPKGAAAILDVRREHTLKGLGELRKIGVLAERAAPFITLDGQRPPFQPVLL